MKRRKKRITKTQIIESILKELEQKQLELAEMTIFQLKGEK